MKKLFALLITVALFASCEKEACRFGHIEVWNTGTTPVVIHSIPSSPVLLPGETAIQDVEFCEGFDVNGYACVGDEIQTVVSYEFEDGERTTYALIVTRCQTSTVKISN